MTKDASFKKVVRRHAGETGQRYTEALTDLEGLGARMDHEPVAERLLAHLRDRYRRALTNGSAFHEWGFIEPPAYFSSTAAATRAAFRR